MESIKENIEIIESNRRHCKHDLYVVAGQLRENNVASIDSWTFFLWLQENKVPSVYILKENDDFYKTQVKDKGFNDIIVLKSFTQGEELLSLIDVWSRACAFVVEWDLGGTEIDYWIRDLEDCRYVFLQHGIIGTSVHELLLHPCRNIYNDVNVSSYIEKNLIEEQTKLGVCFVAGLPRYDLLNNNISTKNKSETKDVLVMFTWRHELAENPDKIYQSIYFKNILLLLSDDNIARLKAKNVCLLLALHHSLIKYCKDLHISSNVRFIAQEDIAHSIRDASALITDFSSVSFDFLFQKKPVIYWIPDKACEYADSIDRLKIRSAVERRTLFPNVVETSDEVMNLLLHYADLDFVLERNNLQKIESWFTYRSAFSKHVYCEIERRLENERSQKMKIDKNQTKEMKLSVITINYNNLCGLQRTIPSVISQTYRDFEFVVIDGNSTDGSREYLISQKQRIDILVSEPDTGIYNAMNKGVRLVNGEYCIFMNSGDTFYSSHVIEQCIDKLDGTDYMCGRSLFMKDPNISSFIYIPPVSIDVDFLLLRALSHQSLFCRTDILRKYPFNEDNYIVSDWEQYFRAWYIHGCTYSALEMFVSIYHLDGISTTQNELDAKERDAIIRQIIKDSGSKGLYLQTKYDEFLKMRDVMSGVKEKTSDSAYEMTPKRCKRLKIVMRLREKIDKSLTKKSPIMRDLSVIRYGFKYLFKDLFL